MSNAGYGNHDEGRPGDTPPSAVKSGKVAAEPTGLGGKNPSTEKTVAPSPSAADDEDNPSTPGAGALPADRDGSETDPGAG